jgi:hypothetical protein
MRKHDRLSCSPFSVKQLRSIVRCEGAHTIPSFPLD